ncbi:MAG: hypothetical protein ACRD4B_01655, partial [Acidobacteriota bacterium]
DDETSRQDIIEAMRDVVERRPAQLDKAHKSLLKEGQKISQFKARDGIKDHYSISNILTAEKYSRRGAYLAAVHDTCGLSHDYAIIPDYMLKKQPRRVRAAYERGKEHAEKFLNNPAKQIATLTDEDFEDTELREILLAKYYNNYFNISEGRSREEEGRVSADPKSSALAELADLEGQFETLLGQFDANEERIIKVVDEIGDGIFKLAEVVKFGISEAEADITVGVNNNGAISTVVVDARPGAMNEARPVNIYRLDANRCTELGLSEAEAAELAGILGKVSLDKNPDKR